MLDVTMASRANGVNGQQFSWKGSGAERWRVQGIRSSNVNSGKCLDVAYQSRADGGSVNQWDCHRGASLAFVDPIFPIWLYDNRIEELLSALRLLR